MKQLVTALKLYREDNGNYPTVSGSLWGSGGIDDKNGKTELDDNLVSLVSEGYIPEIPHYIDNISGVEFSTSVIINNQDGYDAHCGTSTPFNNRDGVDGIDGIIFFIGWDQAKLPGSESIASYCLSGGCWNYIINVSCIEF